MASRVCVCVCCVQFRGGRSTLAECGRALKGLALPRASHSGEIADMALRSSLAAAPVLFAHAVVTVAKSRTSATPSVHALVSDRVRSFMLMSVLV